MTLSLALVADFVLIVARTMAWLYAAPVFSDRGFSSFARMSTALALAFFLTPALADAALGTAAGGGADTTSVGAYVLLAAGQIAAGLVLGWAASVLLAAFEGAGQLIDLQSGFAVATLLDPQSGNQAAIFARFTRLLFVTLLFATGAHHQLLRGFVLSFRVVPLNELPSFNFDITLLVKLISTMMVASLQIAAPVLGALFITEVTLAVAQRFAPTANVFMVGLPLKTLVTLSVLGSGLLFYPMFIERLVNLSLEAGSTLLGS